MSQTIWGTIVPSTTSGTQLAQYLNDFKEAMVSSMSGTSRPTELAAGGVWLDITNDPIWSLKLWTGVSDIELFSIDTTGLTASPGNASGEFSVTQESADTVSPFLTLLKRRLINNGQVLSGDYVGTLQFKGNADDLSVPVVARIRAIATENFTGTNAGTDLIFECTPAGSAAPVEILRIKNNFFGIGTNSPETRLDVNGATNIREMAAPAVSSSGMSRVYMDSTSKKVRVSENGGSYKDLSPDRRANAVSLTQDVDEVNIVFSSSIGTTNYVPSVSFINTIDTDPIFIQYTVIERSATGMKLRITPPPTGNYVAAYKVESYE